MISVQELEHENTTVEIISTEIAKVVEIRNRSFNFVYIRYGNDIYSKRLEAGKVFQLDALIEKIYIIFDKKAIVNVTFAG